LTVLFRAAQERRTHLSAPRRPSRNYADERLVWSSIHARRSLDFLRIAQHFRAHRHVLLLHGGRHGSQISKVYLVEKVSHCLPDGI